jgi:hypothetical protein
MPIDYFTTTIQKQRQRKHSKITKEAGKAMQERHYMGDGTYQNMIKPEKIEVAMSKAIEQDMDNFSSQEALDYERAYYKVCSLLNLLLLSSLMYTTG